MFRVKRCQRICVIAAEPESLLTKLAEANVEVWDVEKIDHLTVALSIYYKQLPVLKYVVEKEGAGYSTLKKVGITWWIMSFFQRPVLVGGITLFLLLASYLSDRILFFEVIGNEIISDSQILFEVENCGVSFGSKASELRSETVKNYMLERLPQLQWLGITTSGCVATIHVTERSLTSEEKLSENIVSSIIASQNGVITQMTVLRGNPLFQEGQSVKAGDTLISAYTDLGRMATAQRAEGEVFAYTSRQLYAITPASTLKRGKLLSKTTDFMFRIGKKVINLWNHSGISGATCVKMYEEDYWTLPGGFQLPISVIKVTNAYYETYAPELVAEDYQWMEKAASDYLVSQMVAGRVFSESLNWNIEENFCEIIGHYACHEMIGQVKHEEILEQYAKDH